MPTLTPVDFDPFAQQSAQGPKLTPVDFDPFAPQQSLGEDVGKSLASGVGKGAAALPGIVGDIQELSRAGGRKLGFEPPEHSMFGRIFGRETAPTSRDTISAAAEYVPGLNYQPQTTVGEYASTVGQFLPAAVMGPGGMARNAVRYGVVPGVAAETAGKATAGTEYEPYARFLAAVAGAGLGNAVTNMPGKIISPVTQAAERAPHVSLLQQEGVPLTAGQVTGSKPIQWLEAAAADMPFSSKSAADLATEQGRAFTEAATKRMGSPNPVMGDAEWAASKARFKDRYGDLTSRNTLQMDYPFAKDIGDAVANYYGNVNPTQRAPAFAKYVQDIIKESQAGARIEGPAYQAMRSNLGEMARGAGPQEAIAYGNLRKALDGAMGRSISPEDKAAWDALNKEYGAYKTLQKAATGAGESSAQGMISPAKLRSTVAARSPSAFLEGKSELGNLAQAGEAVMKPLPSSGTAQRSMYMNMLQGGPVMSAGLGGAIAGIPGAVAGATVPALLGRAVMSQPVQRYLQNNLAARYGLLAEQSLPEATRGILASAYSEATSRRRKASK